MAKRRRKRRRKQPSFTAKSHCPTLIPEWIPRLFLSGGLIAYGSFSLITGIGFFPLLSDKNRPPRELTWEISPGAARFLGAVLVCYGVKRIARMLIKKSNRT